LVACQSVERGESKTSPQSAELAARSGDDDFDRDVDECRRDEFTRSEPGEPIRRQRPDRELRKILREIDHNQIETTIRKLVSFGTRHTLSSQTDPVRGIGAATNWVFDTLSGYAAASGGRMTVERQ